MGLFQKEVQLWLLPSGVDYDLTQTKGTMS